MGCYTITSEVGKDLEVRVLRDMRAPLYTLQPERADMSGWRTRYV
jgi:hypothetical protein